MTHIQHKFEVDINRNGNYDHVSSDITPYVIEAIWQNGIQDPFGDIATPARATLTLDNSTDLFFPEKASDFKDTMVYGTLVRISAYGSDTYPIDGGDFDHWLTDRMPMNNCVSPRLSTGDFDHWLTDRNQLVFYEGISYQQLYEGRVVAINPTPGARAGHRTVIVCEDPMLELLDSELQPELKTSVTTDNPLQEIFDNALAPYPYASSYWIIGASTAGLLDTGTKLWQHTMTDFDTGSTTLGFIGDTSDTGQGVSTQGYIRENMTAEAGGRFFWEGRRSLYAFHRRHRDLLNTTVSATLTATHLDRDAAVMVSNVDILNNPTTNYQPRKTGSALSILWTSQDVPFKLRRGEERTFSARYRDPSNEDATVGGTAMVSPEATTDFTANKASDGTGENRTVALSVHAEFGATSAKVSVKNTRDTAGLWVTKIQLRGTPLLTFDQEQFNEREPDSIQDTMLASRPLHLPMVDSSDFAEDYTQVQNARFGTPLHRYQNVPYTANDSGTLAGHLMDLVIGNRINVEDDEANHDQDYIIVGENHRVVSGGHNLHTVSYVVKPIAQAKGWVLETTGRGELDQNTWPVF